MPDIRVDLNPQHALLPLQLRSLQILQMSFDELASYVMSQAWQNPLIELDYSEECFQPLIRRVGSDPDAALSWIDRLPDRVSKQNSLQSFLLEQLPVKNMDGTKRLTLAGLINSLDDHGYLRDPLADLSRAWGIPMEMLVEALQMLQTLEPPGVGARSLKECLTLQALRAPAAEAGDALRIIESCLDLVAKGQYAGIGKALRMPRERVMAAVARIKRMNPYPGAGFDPPQPSIPVVPDVIVEPSGSLLTVRLSERNSFSLSANKVYLAFMQTTDDNEAREYLKDKYNDYIGLCSCIRQRTNTLLSIGYAVTVIQRGFFLSEGCALSPMSQKDVAELIGVNVSTVSRAVQNKYLRCRWGTFDLKYFFTRSICGEDPQRRVSSDEIGRAIRQAIDAEDCSAPLSDEAIARRLAGDGLNISRRTVTKYREKLLLPNAFYRKRQPISETE